MRKQINGRTINHEGAAMTVIDDIRGLWCALVPAAQVLGKSQRGFDAGKPAGKHRAGTARRPYAPVGRTGARIYRSNSHRHSRTTGTEYQN